MVGRVVLHHDPLYSNQAVTRDECRAYLVWQHCFSPVFLTNLFPISWRRGESNPRPKSATPRSLHAYLSSLGSPAALGTSKKRTRLVRWFSPKPYGPKGLGQLTVRRLLPGP